MPMSSEDAYLEEEDDDGSDDDEDGYGDYYTLADADHMADQFSSTTEQDFDPELSEYECFTQEKTEQFLKENVDTLANNLQIRPPLAKLLLHMNSWSVVDITRRFASDRAGLLSDSCISLTGCMPDSYLGTRSSHAVQECAVCLAVHSAGMFRHLACQHSYCQSCWGRYAEAQLHAGVATRMSCMATHCPLILPEDFILPLLSKALLEKFHQFAFRDYVKSHPLLRLCSGSECGYVIRAWEVCSKKVVCSHCHKAFCFQCGCEPHAPTDCHTIRRWLTKCADDSETANYISAHTKDCPKCHICIEKNGGCNHMQCYSCKFDFCWMCLQDWKLHGSEYYECSRYKENPNIVNESAHAQAREALKKYLFYFERWENHAKSLRLEQQTLQKIRERIQAKVMVGEGTWIDWQYLIEASHLLAKCRYTLQYTYPYAYYMELGPRKELFEYQQAQLEAEIENLAWKVEHAETTHRGDLQNQMDVAAKRRATLLYHFSSL